ncbi:hypothetical protein M3N55_15095 [Roseibaca sp. V10]|uniref:Curlin associated repeat-containing protein n=1 Tax=Roseinatronobacter domitianus TaxID=2940293 RepID=A0ABT0M5B4_9RHOB|nr:hypothetical protein [Roseibaca domitiana]MCL1630060.1 hypothetical protein [Roseibaca domitiana]
MLLKQTYRGQKLVTLVVMSFIFIGGNSGISDAQNVSGPGQSWSATWGFSSPSDRSLRLQAAQAIRNAERGSDPTTIVNNYNDNRSNYQEVVTESGTLGAIDFQIGDEIGQNTNAVGAMNTGSTEISITGDGNLVDAINSADSNGCVDGSVLNETLSLLGALEQGNGFDVQLGNSPNSACD